MNDDVISECAKAIQEASKATGKGIDASRELGTFIGRYVRGPFEQAFGLLEDHLRFTRIERRMRLMSRFHQIAKSLGEENLTKRLKLNVAVPLMLEGVLEEDDDLQDRYAQLLVNAVNRNAEVETRRFHIDILTQLGTLEVQILDALQKGINVEGSDNGVISSFLPERIETSTTLPNLDPFPLPTEEQRIALLNLLRLGCIGSTSVFANRESLCAHVVITSLGISLVKACTVVSHG